MFPEDDFLTARPARRERTAIVRIALMALIGCLALLTVLVIQARAEADAVLRGPAAPSQSLKAPVPAPPVQPRSGA